MTDAHGVVRAHIERVIRGEGKPAELVADLERMSPSDLTSILPSLFGTGGVSDLGMSLRDAGTAILYRRLSESIVESLKALDRSTKRLTIVGWWITIAVGVASVVFAVR